MACGIPAGTSIPSPALTVLLFNELIKQKISAEKLEVFFDVMKIINNALEEDPKLILEGIQKHIKS